MKYSFNKNSNIYVKRNGDEAIILDKNTNKQIMLNQSGLEIYDCVERDMDFSSILACLHNKYQNVDVDTLSKDIEGVLTVLSLYDIIYLDDQIKPKEFHIADVREYRYINQFIRSNSVGFRFPESLKAKDYDPVEMRYRAVNNNEQYGILVKNVDSFANSAVIAYVPPVANSNVFLITALVMGTNINRKEAFLDFNELIKNTYSYKRHIKLRIILSSASKTESEIERIVKSFNFIEECRLLNEIEDYDVAYYSCCS